MGEGDQLPADPGPLSLWLPQQVLHRFRQPALEQTLKGGLCTLRPVQQTMQHGDGVRPTSLASCHPMECINHACHLDIETKGGKKGKNGWYKRARACLLIDTYDKWVQLQGYIMRTFGE